MQRSAKAWSHHHHSDRFKQRDHAIRHNNVRQAGLPRAGRQSPWVWGATLLPFIGISLVYMGVVRGDVALSLLLASFACGIFLIRFCKTM